MVKKRVIHKEEKVIESKPEEHQPPTIVTQIVEVIESDRSTEGESRHVASVVTPEPVREPPQVEPVHETPQPEAIPEPVAEPEHPLAASYEEIVEEEEGEKPAPDPEPQTPADTEKQKQVVEELFNKRESRGLTEITIEKGKKGNKAFLWAFIVIVAAVTSGIGLLLLSGRDASQLGGVLADPSPTQVPAPTVAPTQAPALVREDIDIQVLNGGGVPGAASKMRTSLTDLGYNVSDVGNTEDYSWEETEVLVKSGNTQLLTMLEEDLKDDYTIGSSSATLPEDVTYDARVIVGQK